MKIKLADNEIKKRKLALRKVAKKVFENIIMKSEILEITVAPEVDRNEMVSIQTGFSKVTFRVFKK